MRHLRRSGSSDFPAAKPARVWILVEEVETGSDPEGNTYTILSAHTRAEGANEARDEWRRAHGFDDHAFNCGHHKGNEECDGQDDSDWCQCGLGATIDEVEVQR